MLVSSTGLSLILNHKMKQRQTGLQKTMEKLATGQRIRSAANDASGLAISQKLLALSRGSHQAIRNVQDAGSLVQVADGAMKEMTDIIHRIRELSVQAMNGTNTELNEKNVITAADTLMIQNEVDELKKNLNDIVHNTEFNGKKLLSNTDIGEYIYENRTAAKTLQLSQVSQTHSVDVEINRVGKNEVSPVSQTDSINVSYKPATQSVTIQPESYIGSTIVDHQPRWTADGNSIVFSSSRGTGEYIVPADGSSDPIANTTNVPTEQNTLSAGGLMKLVSSGSTLYLENYNATDSRFDVYKTYSYNQNDGNLGYSFSPTVDENGNTSFVFADPKGNLQRIDVNLNTQSVTSGPTSVISTSDTLDLDLISDEITLPSSPALYRMNTATASFRVEKVNDNGTRELAYWNGTDTAPTSGGYYTVTDGTITFFGEAIIGNESVDDAQDYYNFYYVSDGFQNEVYTASIPSGAEIYNIHGEEGPRSLKIIVGGVEVTKSQLLSEKPSDVNGTTGVYVDETSGEIEFYGDLRPAADESITIEYLSDSDGRNQIPSFYTSSSIDTYNLTNLDLTTNRSLRVYVGGKEIAYDSSLENGYTFSNGYLSLYGDARPDVSANEEVKIDYVYEYYSYNTPTDVYGIKLKSTPEVYNLGSTTSPSSIRVFRNATEEIAYSNEDGFQYNAATNTIELYGKSRPNVGDNYSVQMVIPTGDYLHQDGKVEVPLTYRPETYGTPNPSTFRVLVDGAEVNYDSTKSNGYFYNSATNRLELYGDARPEAGGSSNPDVEVYYVYESQSVAVGNDSYDFLLASNTLDYGVENQTSPKAIRVYQNGAEVPYDADNGFTYDSTANQLSLNGSFRPDKNDSPGDFKVYSITADDLTTTVPQDSYIYKVELNGQEIPDGDGYRYDGQRVEIIGDYRPDVTDAMSGISLRVQYVDSLGISLDESMPQNYFHNYCEHESDKGLMDPEIDPTNLVVSLNGDLLSSNQFLLQDGKVLLNKDRITLNAGNNSLQVDYRVRRGIGYEANDFTFQVGANSGQDFNLKISSFDNILLDTNAICVRTHEDASKGIKVIDDALDYILNELGQVGAVQNSLDHIASNLSVLEENTLTSLSRIQDTDMAKQAMNLVKDQIITQVQQAMAAQVKTSSEQVLELLK
jgi:flagellin-like hook-associated protein FlgL